MKRVGGRVLLAYGGGSLRRTGLYDKVVDWLHECGKTVVDFGGILPNPAYDKVQQGARLVRDEGIDFIPRRGRRLGHRLLQDNLGTGAAGRRHLGDAVRAASVPHGVRSDGCRGHHLGHGRRAEQRHRHHPHREEAEAAPGRRWAARPWPAGGSDGGNTVPPAQAKAEVGNTFL